MKSLFYLLSLFLFLLYSCEGKDDSAEPNYYAAKFISQLNPTDTFLYATPPIKDSQHFSAIQWKRKYEKELALQSLEKGFDSIQIRIWYGCALGVERLVILENSNHKWHAEISGLNYYEDSMSRSIVSMQPKSGWEKFIDRLFDLKILTLINQNEIPNFKEKSVNDGCSASIEIATRNAYRFYFYFNPDDYSYEESINMISILKLINKEFRIKGEWTWPVENPDTTKSISIPKVSDVKIEDIKTDSVKQ